MLVSAFNPFYIPLHQALFGSPGSANMDKENNVIFFILIMAYTVRRFPFTVRSAYAGLQQTHETFEEAAYNLGSSPSGTLRKIVIPLIGSNVFAGALVSFVYSLSESSTTLIWVTNENTATIPYLIYTNYTETITAQNSAAALGVLLIGVQIIAISISNFILRKRGSALTGL